MITAPGERRPVGVLYEHPEWFESMFAEVGRLGVRYERVLAYEHGFDQAEREVPYALLVNRMSLSAFTRGRAHTGPNTMEYLAHLETFGANVLNGLRTYRYHSSEVQQLGLLARLGARTPRSGVIHHAAQAVRAVRALKYQLVVKPNIGGAGIRRFDDEAGLRGAADAGEFGLGLDGVALMQEYHRPVGGCITRMEDLGGRLLYAIGLRLESPDSFNLCPADCCRTPPSGASDGARAFAPLVRAVTPPQHVLEKVLRIAGAAGMEVGGVEYLVSDRDGEDY